MSFKILLLAVLALALAASGVTAHTECEEDQDCGFPNGNCFDGHCVCKEDYWTVYTPATPGKKIHYCQERKKDQLVAWFLSFFHGIFGADWFYLARGNGNYIAAGVFKLLTLGGCGIWWLVDWIRILCDAFPDGQDIPLNSFTT